MTRTGRAADFCGAPGSRSHREREGRLAWYIKIFNLWYYKINIVFSGALCYTGSGQTKRNEVLPMRKKANSVDKNSPEYWAKMIAGGRASLLLIVV